MSTTTNGEAPTGGGPAGGGLVALVRAAVEATGSDGGLLLLPDGGELRVLVAVPGDPGAVTGDEVRPLTGAAGLVSSTGQPVALLPRPGDGDHRGAGGLDGVPGAVLAVPCDGGEVAGVLELARSEARNYGFDDLELATLLGEIGGAVLRDEVPARAPAPADLGADLADLASTDPARYRDVARTVEWMLR